MEKRDTYEEWEERLEAWLKSLPANDPVRKLDDWGQCEAFAKHELAQKVAS